MEPKIKFMREAVKSGIQGIQNGDGGPFGACIVDSKNKSIIATAHNEVLISQNATQHAEIVCITKASQMLKTWNLSGCILYTTTECCPMCFSAAHWAQISYIVYGTTITDVAKLGFNELPISNETMNCGNSKIHLYKEYFRSECLKLLNTWKKLKNTQLY